jgi:hypothetical protein
MEEKEPVIGPRFQSNVKITTAIPKMLAQYIINLNQFLELIPNNVGKKKKKNYPNCDACPIINLEKLEI